MYSTVLSENAVKQLSKLDKHVAKLLMSWIRKNLDGCSDPYVTGKPLVGDLKGVWRYRVGRYRILAEIYDDRLIILVIAVGDRKSIYGA